MTNLFGEPSTATPGGGVATGGACPERWTTRRGPPGGGLFPDAGQYSLGSKMVLFMKYRVNSASGKSVYSMALVNTTPPFPSSQVSVAVQSAFTVSFQSWNSSAARSLS